MITNFATSAEAFIGTHNPYRGKYTEQYTPSNELFDGPRWATRTAFLKTSYIQEAIAGITTLGYFANTITNVLGIDIDNHRNYSETWLLDLYNQVVERLRCKPSILVKSPRGLHAYWYLTQPIATNILTELAKSKLQGIPVEIKPDTQTALRIPVANNLIDPTTFAPLHDTAENIMGTAERYQVGELFLENWEHITSRTTTERPRNKRTQHSLFKNAAKLSRGEAEIAPGGFTPHHSNEQFLKLALLYRTSGLDLETAYDRMTAVMARSYLYYGELKQPRRLRDKLKCEYSHNETAYEPTETYQGLFDLPIIEQVLKESPFANQRNEPIKIFLQRLFSWKHFQDEIASNPAEMQVWNFYYKYYWKNRKEGYYPLPKTLLRRWNGHYYEIIPFLEKLGILEPSPYGYSATGNGNGICKYYRINIEALVGKEGNRTVV